MKNVKRYRRAVEARLRPWFQRYGRRRVLIAIGCVLYLLLGGSVILATHALIVEPELHRVAAQKDAPVGPLLWKIRFTSLFNLLTLSALGFGIWWLAAMRPFSEFQRRVRSKLSDSASEEMRVLSYWYERRSSQLEAALEDNRSFREQTQRLSNEQQSILLSREAMLNMTQDAMLLTDADGIVIDVSPATASLLHRTRADLSGQAFEAVAPLYDHRREIPQEHPLKDYLRSAIPHAVGTPRLDQALLINLLHEPIPVLIAVSAISDGEGRTIGAMVRINRLDSAAETVAHSYVAATPVEELSLPGDNAEPTRDWATDLLSKGALDKRLDELAANAAQHNKTHALLFVRVDGLIRINESYGFWAGEQALWHAARTFKEAMEERGSSYRVSNSRFAAVLADCTLEDAMALARRIREDAERRELVWDGKPVSCTLSVAVVMIGISGENRQGLLAKAESLLDEAKARGGNLVLQELPDDAMTLRRREDQHWLTWLEPRLADGRAHLIYQRMQALAADGGLPNLEVFLRVEDDDGVWLEPGHFMPALQRMHRTTELDLWVLTTLLGKLSRDGALLEAHGLACLNFASTSLADNEFGARVFELLAGASVPANRLCFEVDESFAIAQSATLQRFMDMIRPTGVRFALDRCHTTMGITHLRHLPVDTMKIHPRVTRHIESDPLDRTHLEWICQAAHLLGRKTAAINIESTASLQLLRNAGVDYAQGFAIGKYEMMLK